MTERIHWRKSKNSKFLNGEDLKFGLIDGVLDGMAVEISGVNITESFDVNEQEKSNVVELKFKKLDGTPIKKGIIPGLWAYKFMKYNGIKSPIVNDWVGKKLIIYALADIRHGHVVRFKKYVPTFDFSPYTNKLKACKNLDELAECYKGLDKKIQNQPVIIKCKDELKASYENN